MSLYSFLAVLFLSLYSFFAELSALFRISSNNAINLDISF